MSVRMFTFMTMLGILRSATSYWRYQLQIVAL